MEYLARKGKSRIYHLFQSGDTLCRLYSTGGMSKQKYEKLKNVEGKRLCVMCENVSLWPKHKAMCDNKSPN